MGRYQASLPDELDLRPGMKLKVLRLYDDAWGTAQVVSGGMEGERTEGSFPIVRYFFPLLLHVHPPLFGRRLRLFRSALALSTLHPILYYMR